MMSIEKSQFVLLVTLSLIATAMVMFLLMARALEHTELFLR